MEKETMNPPIKETSDELLFAEESQETTDTQTAVIPPWKLLIVDDEEDVHQVTRLVLGDFSYMGRGIEFLHAHSGAEAQQLLHQHPEVAIILLDVVMESDDSGLLLVKYIREEIGNQFVRIILRTGQPGAAPLKSVIVDYDINDYKEKGELTDQKLYATMVTSLREYEHVTMLEQNRKSMELNKLGLEKIIHATNSIFELQSLRTFAQGVLMQFESLSGLDIHSIYTQVDGFSAIQEEHSDFRILAATGRYSSNIEDQVNDALNKTDLARIRKAVTSKTNQFGPDYFVCQVQNSEGLSHVLYIHGENHAIKHVDRELIEVFNTNISVAFENLHLTEELEYTQREIIYTLGEVTEARSYETGFHVKRVGEYSRILAQGCGIEPEQADLLKISAALHDVGKVGIPDAILNKPGRLTEDEFEVMKAHTTYGHKILKKSKRQLLRTAATIAHQHHEHFDGNGYPQHLKGEEIDMFARIVAVADVFEALSSDRIYRPAWDDKQIQNHIREQRGKMFDPEIVDAFFNMLPELMDARRLFAD